MSSNPKINNKFICLLISCEKCLLNVWNFLEFTLSRKKLISCRKLCNFSTFIFLTALFTSTVNEFLYKLYDHKL